ncbi:MAG: hypothetical protein DMG13_16480 [Acidobacteria bacterium]|nr:MAG: hypothetical protein DMG13_16480 [Acidobacteriota bacterium]
MEAQVWRQRIPALFIGCILYLIVPTAVWAQATTQISGTARDASGAVLPGVQVTATQTDTGISRMTVTNETGFYVLPSLPLGPYRLEATLPGFRTFAQTGIVLQVGSSAVIDVKMEVGEVAQSVEVQSDVAQVETRKVGIGTIVENTQRILDLPLNGRQPTDLISLGGAAVVQNVAPVYTINGGVQISVAGGTSFSVQYSLDGASHLDTWFGQNMPLPFPDALQEFRLSTSTQDASEGGRSAAAVNAVTKSGTNSFHGDAFEFFRNGKLNGRDFFAAANDHLKRNQFGGVLGGPIKKDKLFFFLGYQGTLIRQTPNSTVSYVPTSAMLQGDFSAYIANNCPEAARISPTVLSPTNQLTRPINASAAALGALLPKPVNACGVVRTGNPLSTNQLQAPARVDYQLTDQQTLFGRYLISRTETIPPYALQSQNLLTTTGTGNDDTAHSLALGHTYVISPALVNSFRVFGNRMGVTNQYKPFLNPGPAAPQVAGLPSLGIQRFTNCPGPGHACLPGMVSLVVPGDFSVGNPASINMVFLHFTNFGLNEDVNWIRGRHQISFGGHFMHLVEVEDGDAWIPGVFTFGTLSVAAGGTGSPMADFLTGTVGNLHQVSKNPNNNTQSFFNLYGSDVWKVNSRLTLSYGFRWNPYLPLQWMDGSAENFSLSRFYANMRSNVIPSAPPGFTFPGDPGFEGRSGIRPIWNQFEPRIGFAYDPFGDGKTAIRANGGIAHDFLQAFPFQNSPGVAPFVTGLSLNGPLNFSDPYANVPGGNPFPYVYTKGTPFPTFPPYQGFYPYQSDLPNTQQQSWGVSIQRQVTPSVFVSGSYIGTHLIHLWDALELNPALYIAGTCAAGQYGLTAPGPTILGSMDSFDTSGTQSYHGLLLSATYRKGNTSLSGNYTWSHCIGMPIIGTTNIGSTYEHAPYQNNGPQNRYLDYGDCYTSAVDVRHVANATLVTSTPAFSRTWKNATLGGWHFGTIFTIRTGVPLTPNLGSDVALNGFFASSGSYNYVQRPNQVLSDVYATNKGQSCPIAPCVTWLNRAAFATPAPGTYGNMAFGTVRGPKFWEWDQSIYKDFRVAEGQTLQVRAEAFNVTNSVRFAPPNMVLTNGLFGSITSDYSTTGSAALTGSGGRIIQLALKYVF